MSRIIDLVNINYIIFDSRFLLFLNFEFSILYFVVVGWVTTWAKTCTKSSRSLLLKVLAMLAVTVES